MEHMRLCVLFSGGKDSAMALYKSMQKEEVVCLVSIISKNKESYMYHTPNIHITEKQADVIGLPLIRKETDGIKEKELDDLREAIQEAKDIYNINGVVTGAIESVYQSTRIQKICADLDLWCFNPLWKKDQIKHLKELLENKFSVIISGVFALPLEEFLGKELNKNMIEKLKSLELKYKINPSGEGGEFETTVLDAPFFKKKIVVKDSEIRKDNNSGIFIINKVELVEK